MILDGTPFYPESLLHTEVALHLYLYFLHHLVSYKLQSKKLQDIVEVWRAVLEAQRPLDDGLRALQRL